MSQFIEMFGDFHNKVQIKDVCLVVSGKSIPTKLEDIDGNNPYIKVADFNIPGNEKYITIAQRYVSDDSASYSKQIPEGSVIFAKNGAASMSNKKRLTKIRCCIDMNTMAVFPKNESILSDFLFATIEAMDVSSHVRQGAIPSISPKSIEDSYIAMPTMEEQYRYVSIAKHADKSGFDGRKSQFIEMFGCLAERVALSSLCDTFIDGDWIEAKDQSGSGIRLIQTGNVGVGTFKDKGDRARYISEETFNRLNCTEVVEGDILISRLPEPVGRACIIPAGLGKSITAVDCTIIRLNDKVLPKFFVTFTNTPDYAMQIKKVLSGTTRLRVSRANLGKIQVPLPAIDKQQQFVTIAEQADKSGSGGRESVALMGKVKKSLINYYNI